MVAFEIGIKDGAHTASYRIRTTGHMVFCSNNRAGIFLIESMQGVQTLSPLAAVPATLLPQRDPPARTEIPWLP
jgi:hypothetical protein